MIPTTPRKLVHWASQEISFSELESPFGNDSTDSMASTSTMEYLNSQLVAHGFIYPPGLSVEGISKANLEKVVKCMLGMLSQRVEDMTRTEELTTKFRTLSYDNERLMTMHRNAMEKAANAEREMNIYKTRLTTTIRSLQATESAHKQTMAELQRTRTTVQAIRSTHNAELKKKEKDMERMTDKWTKIADAQTKLLSTPSGMRCANVAVVDGCEVLGKGQGFLEIALEQSEKARSQFNDENLHLKRLILKAVNEIQRSLHDPQLQNSATAAEPTEYTLATLFPVSPSTAANTTISSILTSFREYVASLSGPKANSPSAKPSLEVPNGEIERLQSVINSLKEEIERSQKQTLAHATETQAMFDKFAEDHRITNGDIGEMSVEFLSIPLQDEAKARLDKMRAELDQERKIFTDAAIKLGREKAALEIERVKLLDQKRIWQVEMMLADLPPTPLPASPAKVARLSPQKSPQKSPKKSPSKPITVGKTSSRKTTRVARRSLSTPIKVIAAYETEVLPPLPAPSFLALKSLPPAVSLLATSFVLPPPSPHASLPTKPALPPSTSPQESQVAVISTFTPSESESMPSTPPVRRPFPVAKPFAQRMMHAYSPAKPSPLSRILMLADSPATPRNEFDTSPSSGPLQAVAEEQEDDERLGLESDQLFPKAPEAPMSLAAELGVESPPHIPLHEMNMEPNKALSNRQSGVTARERVFYPNPNRKNLSTVQEKAKGKAEPIPSSTATVRNGKTNTSAVGEKENSDGRKGGKVSPVLVIGAPKSMPGDSKKLLGKAVNRATTGTSMPRAKSVTKQPPPVKGGPRRVLVDSVDAPPIGKGWRG